MKCDEIRPICGQCRKSSRSCKFSATANFRHYESPRKRRGVQALTGSLLLGKGVDHRPRRHSTAASTATSRLSPGVEENDALTEEAIIIDDGPRPLDVSNDEDHHSSVQNDPSPMVSSDAIQIQLNTTALTTDMAGASSESATKCPRALWQSLLMHFKQGPGTW